MKKLAYYLSATTLLLISMLPVSAFAEVVANGELTPAFSSWGNKSVIGSWKIVKEDQAYVIVLGDDFSAKDGPDVKVFLSPKKASDIDGSNAAEGSLFVTQITRFKGQYRIDLPKDVNLDSYQALVFHCEEYSKLWGTSPLR